jgi:ferrochelatase
MMDRRSIRVEIGMRSAEPSIRTALQRLKFWGATDLILLPLFPQFSTTTTGTCFDEVNAVLKELNWNARVREIRSWAEHPTYIRLLRHTVDEAVSAAEARRTNDRDPVHVVFSAHSLPLKIVKLGDQYPFEIEQTVAGVTRTLKQPWSLAFQSRNGRLPWLQPYLEDELKRLGDAGLSNIVVVPISFVSDHIETLFELDQLYARVAKEHGITNYQRARCFNDDPLFAELLYSLLAEHAADVMFSENQYKTKFEAVIA